MVFFLPTTVRAIIYEADDPVFGVGALTRDTDQGLDFLDVTLSTNQSYNDVSGQFGVGGDYEGFRYATEDEVIALVNNWGFNPSAVAGGSVYGAPGDQLSGLVSLLAATGVFEYGRYLYGITGTPAGDGYRFIYLEDVYDNEVPHDRFLYDFVYSSDWLLDSDFGPVTGSYLVRDAVEPIPEPMTIVLMGFGVLGLLGIVIRQRRKRK